MMSMRSSNPYLNPNLNPPQWLWSRKILQRRLWLFRLLKNILTRIKGQRWKREYLEYIFMYLKMYLDKSKKSTLDSFGKKIKVYLVFSGRVLLTFSNFPILIQSSFSEKVGKQSLVEVDPMAEGVTAANTVSCWYFFFKKYIWLIHFLHHNRRSALPLTRW